MPSDRAIADAETAALLMGRLVVIDGKPYLEVRTEDGVCYLPVREKR